MSPSATITFWGTRGSIARPGPLTLRHGGNTSCVEVTSGGGTRVVIDCGTGAYDLGRSLRARGTPSNGSLLISHTHWDHIQGFPFFAPLFVPGGQWDIHGPTGLGKSLRDALSGQMEHTYFPVTLEEMGASIRFHDLFEGEFEIGDIRITTRYLNHTALTLAYRLETGGVSVVYACDHEPYAWPPGGDGALHELDQRHCDFLAGADLVIHDAQFTDAEYATRVGWGHSPVGYVCALGRLAGVGCLALSHHDPSRTDDELDAVVEAQRAELRRSGSAMELVAAADGQVIELTPAAGTKPAGAGGRAPSASAAGSALSDPLVLIGLSDDGLARRLGEAADAAGVKAVRAADAEAVVRLARQIQPGLVLLEDRPEQGIDGLAVCRRLRASTVLEAAATPIVMVAERERTREGEEAGVTQWLATPFSRAYARARLQSWLLRTSCRWVRPRQPPDEADRLAALRELRVLDTGPEERFDRLTRLAAAVAGVPIALVSLVDRDRQWFKSALGLQAAETPREMSICAHVVASRAALVVNDTLLDARFADNPLVTSGPRVRFYAGFPLFHPNGSCLGTLCLIDTRPRRLAPATLERLDDLALLVQEELSSGSRWRAG